MEVNQQPVKNYSNLNLDDDDDPLIGNNIKTTINLSLREFGSQQKILEAIWTKRQKKIFWNINM